MNLFEKNKIIFYALIIWAVLTMNDVLAQQGMATHTRGKLWETLFNDGYIGHPGAWDYEEVTGIGFFPAFPGFYFPNHEEKANDAEKVTNANFHNFRSGPWILAKDALAYEAPAYEDPKLQDYLYFQTSWASFDRNTIYTGRFDKTQNFVGSEDFNPLLPEEINYVTYPTATGIRVKQRSMAWSFPGYDDFIIYDYTFVNTGELVIPALNKVLPLEQTLNEVLLVFHSGISVSTKGTLNFHYDPYQFIKSAAPAGGFGGYGGKPGSDVYHLENEGPDGKGLLYYSRDYNGGREPVPWDDWLQKKNWQDLLRLRPEWEPELQDPACFGFMFLYRTPPPDSDQNPFEADPDYFSVYNDEGDMFKNIELDFNEYFGSGRLKLKDLYEFAQTSFQRENDGKMYCWYTSTFGPYTLEPGDSVRIILAEIAGQMDLKDVVRGDPNHTFPDSSIADIRRNAEAVRRAVNWGIGARVAGIDLAADVPDSPPAPNCTAASTSAGSDTAVISVVWDKLAEESQITDGSGSVFYDGSSDLSGYRIFRSEFEMGVWDLIVDIPKRDFGLYWDADLNKYQYQDTALGFGDEYFYYVQAYNSDPGVWTSANGTQVENLPELVSGDYNRTALTGARTGPALLEDGWDVFVVPNPFVQGDPLRSFGEPTPDKIEFRNLPLNAQIRIYTISGDLVKTLVHGPDDQGNQYGSISWDQRTDSGLRVAPGVYIYVVQSATEGYIGSKTSGKLMIIR